MDLALVGDDRNAAHTQLLTRTQSHESLPFLGSENATFLVYAWPLTSPSVPLHQPVGGAVLY